MRETGGKRESDVRLAFAKHHDLWYDIETGDLLSTKSARQLTSNQSRTLDKQNRVLGRDVQAIKTFLACKDDTCHPVVNTAFDLNLIENWSDTTLAILNTSDAIKEELDMNDIMSYESDTSIGKILLVDRTLKNQVIQVLTKMGALIAFVTREAVEQSFRSKQIQTFSSELPMKRQDRFFQIVQDNVLLTMVFDGHGSNNVIEFISSNYYDLADIIAEPFPQSQTEALTRTRTVFKKFETRIKSVRNASHSGSTVVLAAHKLSTKQCFFAHIGDSRVVWMNKKGRGASVDHKPNSSDEQKRIEEAGGFVSFTPKDAPRVAGVLATSRSFGDTGLKVPENRAKKDFVSVVPDVDGPFTFEPGSFYVLGSDGVFDVVENDEILDRIQRVGSSGARQETQAIAQLARSRGSMDDITLVTVYVS